MNTHDYKLFQIAAAVARTSTHNKARIGAVIVNGKDIVAVGVNGRKSHPLQKKYNSLRFTDDRANHLMHAELDAIVKARAFLDKGTPTIYIYRQLGTGARGNCRPCIGCMNALRDHRIHDVYYTTEQGLAYEQLT